jgi:hypothetical protein
MPGMWNGINRTSRCIYQQVSVYIPKCTRGAGLPSDALLCGFVRHFFHIANLVLYGKQIEVSWSPNAGLGSEGRSSQSILNLLSARRVMDINDCAFCLAKLLKLVVVDAMHLPGMNL